MARGYENCHTVAHDLMPDNTTGQLYGQQIIMKSMNIKKRKERSQLNLQLPVPGPNKCIRPRLVISSKTTLVPTVAFDTYWRFAAERQNIFVKRATGLSGPWTTDPILSRFRFTNVYRASDRVSQYLIANIQYSGLQDVKSIFFRTILFKLFNKIETWELLKSVHGTLDPEPQFAKRYSATLDSAMDSGQTIYSAAYIMPSGAGLYGYRRKHQTHLALLGQMLKDDVPERLQACRTMRQAFNLLRTIPTFGDFLAYQYAIDINYSSITDFDESEFVMPGPGACSGIKKCFSDIGNYSESDVIRWMVDHQEEEFAARGIKFHTLWGRRLQLIDCQNLFCEVDKYCRVYHPDLQGTSTRNRIKQEYRHNRTPLLFWFPPKWHLEIGYAHARANRLA